MAALVESAGILSKDHVCCVCVNVAATSICLHCGDMLCQSCTNVHAKLSMSRHHKVESLTSLTPERLSASRPASCSAHTDRAPELFCPKHGVSVCLLCAMSDHQDCRKEKLEKKVDEARAILGDLVTTLSEGEKALERAIIQLDQHLLDIDKTTQATMADIDAACDRLESSVRTCRRRLKELAKAADADMKAEVHGGKASPEFRFHTNHGKNIVLSDDQRSAERVRGEVGGIVLSSDPMMVNTLYEVKTSIGQALCLPEGCRVGVLVDDAGCLHLYKDGQDLGVAVSNVTRPCYAFFDVWHEYKKWPNHA
nr:hypothetical protein BaRGS_025093 [Batillaria attramentaria]